MRPTRAALVFVSLASIGALTVCRDPDATEPPVDAAFDPGVLSPNAPPETEHLGQLAGVWDIEQQQRKPDGSWGEPETAEWRFSYTLDGHAVRDDWIKTTETPAGDRKTFLGTNVRIYDPARSQWDMAWFDNQNRKLTTFTAVNVGDTVVMSGTNVGGRPVRNTFFDIEPAAFQWVQEWTFDDGATWVPVSRIRATRRPDGDTSSS